MEPADAVARRGIVFQVEVRLYHHKDSPSGGKCPTDTYSPENIPILLDPSQRFRRVDATSTQRDRYDSSPQRARGCVTLISTGSFWGSTRYGLLAPGNASLPRETYMPLVIDHRPLQLPMGST